MELARELAGQDDHGGTPKWSRVFSTQTEYVAIMVRHLLEQHDIPAFLVNKRDTAYTSIGFFEIMVPQRQILEANYLLAKAPLVNGID